MTKRPPGESLGTVQRVVEVIRFFSERGEATLKELSMALSLAPSTCHRLLDLLGREGLIEQDTVQRRYRIGTELFRIAARVQSREDICRTARPLLQNLVSSCNETCVLSIFLRSEGKIYFAERADSNRELRYQLTMNTPVSVLWGASGRAILAFLDSETIDHIYEVEGRAPGSGEALPSRRALEKDLALIRERGYDVTHGQKIAGAVGISSPVFGVDGQVFASVCVTAPESRIKSKDVARLGGLVRQTAMQLSEIVGAPVAGKIASSA
ncbi:IclR family transcriptional regulator [Microbacteriaceae bacterium K1510]|nr:IclR family transcriptional regulator [Microbacteriaceae bacterium K1510]